MQHDLYLYQRTYAAVVGGQDKGKRKEKAVEDEMMMYEDLDTEQKYSEKHGHFHRSQA